MNNPCSYNLIQECAIDSAYSCFCSGPVKCWRAILCCVAFGVSLMYLAACPAAIFADTGVTATLPDGRKIHPVGDWIPVAPYPFALAVRPDGDQIAIPSIGYPFALNVITCPSCEHPIVSKMPSGSVNDPNIEVDAGLAYSQDGTLLYVATGDSGKIRAYHTSNWTVADEVSLDAPVGGHDPSGSFAETSGSFTAAVTLAPDGKTLYVLDQGNWRVVLLDAKTLRRISDVPTGAYPFGLALSPDGTRLYVTNTGLFEYKAIPGTDPQNSPLKTGLHFPPFGYPSKAAREGVVVEDKQVPGLGDENSVRGSSLWTYDVSDIAHPKVIARLRLGTRITETSGGTVGGAAPTGVAALSDMVYVTLAHDDEVVKVSADGLKILARVELSPFSGSRFEDRKGRPLRGVMPSGIAIRDGRIYVAESGIDAVAVLDAVTLKVIEHIPVGWNPSAVALSPDDKTLYVVNSKGKGSGPNGGSKHAPNSPSYIGALELGSVSVITLADLPSPQSLTQAVIDNNMADITNHQSPPFIKHVFLIIRENRTYDEVLGDVPGANGDAMLARYGMDGWAEEDSTATHLKVTPNLHALVTRFAMSDNYFVDSDVSVDGHRWVIGINPTPFFNTAWTAAYPGRRHGDPTDAQPGRRAPFGSDDGPMPEDEPQFGSLWEHVATNGKSLLNYGEGLEIEGDSELPGSEPEGQRLFLNAPLPEPVFESTDRRYPTFNLGIPDQYRVAEFERDFRLRIAAHRVPSLIVIRLPNDHTADVRPADGYPYRASYVADNDLATGRIIAFLSNTAIWKDSVVFITEDDAQSGVDHVDAHRSVLLVVSPWVRPGVVSHAHTSMGSITRTIDELLGLGPMNLEDALAGDISDIWDTQTHLAPFAAQPSDNRVFNPAAARLAKPRTKEAAAALLDMDDPWVIDKEMEKSSSHLQKPAEK